MPQEQTYRLTQTAELQLLEANAWSTARWGAELTERYFADLHEAAESLHLDHEKRPSRTDLSGGTGLKIRAVREHYLVYVPTARHGIVIVSVIRKSRDIQNILRRRYRLILQELNELENEDRNE